MANLIIQDVFEPYYAGRDDLPASRVGWHPKQAERRPVNKSGDIILPEEAPTPVNVRRERLPVAH